MKLLVGVVLCFVSLSSLADSQTSGSMALAEKLVDKAVAEDNSAFVHARREPQQSTEDARLKINAWIRFNFQQAFSNKAKGDMENALPTT